MRFIWGEYIRWMIMIFVTLGSQKFQFNRLLKKIDELVAKGVITDRVFVQTGASDYKPKNYEYKDFLDREEFAKIMSECDIVITHGGTGAIIGAVKKGKKVIAVPRLAKYGEHVDDHQLQIIVQFKDQNLIYGLSDCEELDVSVKNIITHKFEEYQSNTEVYIKELGAFIDNL